MARRPTFGSNVFWPVPALPAGSYFGSQVAIGASQYSEVAFVSAPWAPNGGSVFYFDVRQQSSPAVHQLGTLQGQSAASTFGCSLSVAGRGTQLLVGDWSGDAGAGAVYVYSVEPGRDSVINVSLSQRLSSPFPVGGYFGSAVAGTSAGGAVLVGAFSANGDKGAAAFAVLDV